MKKIMFLGGSTQQLPAIHYAKKQGYYTILCDYLVDNPGQFLVNEFYCVSTTDQEAILEIAQKANINGIVAYASDPAAPTAAYVGNQLNLPSNPYDSVLTLTKKDQFRKFLKQNGFNCPMAGSFNELNQAKNSLDNFKFPVMVKPIDSSGSKGVSRIDYNDQFDEAFEIAIRNSREKVVIVEEFIEMGHDHMIGGDGFVINGVLDFCGFLNCHRNSQVNPYVPIGKSYPIFLDKDKINKAHREIQRVLEVLNIKAGALNLELMFDKNEQLYIIEIGPRNGGNMIPDLLEMITGVDLVGATVEAALGNDLLNIKYQREDVYYATYVLHSSKKGHLKNIIFNPELEKNLVKKVIYKENGSEVDIFDGANKALGIIFLKFDSIEELQYKIDNMSKYIEIQVV